LLSNEVQLYFTIPESFSGTFTGGNAIYYTSSCVVLRGPDPDNDLPYCEEGNGITAGGQNNLRSITIASKD
jgi:hypothetical protein